MDTTVNAFVKLYQFTSGRRLMVYRQVREIAKELGDTKLVSFIDVAHAFEVETRKLEQRWRKQKSKSLVQDFRPYDYALDRSITAMAPYCESILHGMDEDSPMYKSATLILDLAFPNGVQSVTTLPYEDELSFVEVLLSELKNVKLAKHIKILSLQPMIDNIKVRYKAFFDAYTAAKATPLNHGQIKARHAESQSNLVQMAAIIIGTYHNDEDHIIPRRKLLTPIQHQQSRIASLMQNRRSIPDVDPESGKEVPDSDEESAS